jgi:hypothetical protein
MSGTLLRAKIYTDSAMSRPFQIRYFTPSACHTADPGGITNAHLYTRGGGCIFSTGASEYVATDGYLGLSHDYPPFKAKMREMLAEGERWGRAWVSSGMPITGGMFYGDGSLKPMMFPSNEIPVVSEVSAMPLGSGRMVINVQAIDPDGSLALYEYWINRKYSYGKNEPDSSGESLTMFEKVFDSVTTVHMEVMDNYKARAIVEFTVVPDSGIRRVTGLSVLSETVKSVSPVSELSIQPNPFISGTSIELGLFGGSKFPLKLQIFAANGKLVYSQDLLDGTRKAYWKGTDKKGHKMGNGVYLFMISNGKEARIVRGMNIR